jgi:hypothetical protein
MADVKEFRVSKKLFDSNRWTSELFLSYELKQAQKLYYKWARDKSVYEVTLESRNWGDPQWKAVSATLNPPRKK